MVINKKILSAVVVILGVIAMFFLSRNLVPKLEPISSPSVMPSSIIEVEKSDMIRVVQPISDQVVSSPLIVTGEARGTWYFEASFPVKIYDDNGVELGVIPAQAQGEWMTEEFVPFSAVLKFKKPSTAKGILVLQKDNPSGLPENEAEIRIPVLFNLENQPSPTISNEPTSSTGACKITGCSSQLCSDGDVVTTCEYKDEYACYKTAKCERQPDGKCGWTPNEELVACLYSAWGAPQ